jgi:hypothetical protein
MLELPVQPYRLEPWFEPQPHLDGLEVISISLGPDAALYLLASVPQPTIASNVRVPASPRSDRASPRPLSLSAAGQSSAPLDDSSVPWNAFLLRSGVRL